MRRVLDQISGMLAIVGALAAVVLMLGITVDVANRFITGGSVMGLLELMETSMVFMVFLGMSYAEKTGVHVRMTLVTTYSPVRLAAAMRVVAMLCSVLVVFWLAWHTGKQGISSFTRGEVQMGLIQWPLWPARLVIPVGSFFLGLQLLFRLGDSLKALVTGEPEPIAAASPAEHAAH